MYQQAVEGRLEATGSKGPDELTLVYISNLAGAFRQQCKNDEAEQAYRKVVERRLKILGKKHRDTLTAATWLCNLLSINGKNEEAVDVARQILDEPDEAEEEQS